jgi:hypothetical protein
LRSSEVDEVEVNDDGKHEGSEERSDEGREKKKMASLVASSRFGLASFDFLFDFSPNSSITSVKRSHH